MAATSANVLTAAEIAAAVGGVVLGDPLVRVNSVAPLDRATATDLSFLATARYAAAFAASDAGVVLITQELSQSEGKAAARVVVAKPYDALVALLPRFFTQPVVTPGIHPTAVLGAGASIAHDVRIEEYVVIGAGACIGARAWIGAHTVLGDGVRIGNDSRLLPHVTVYPGAQIGDRTTVHAGTRIGSDGFGYTYSEGAHRKIPHVGRCLIGNDVEIGANCAIDRGSIDDTVVGDGTKLDNLVHLAHNVRVGRLCLLMAHVAVAGSTRLEDGVILAGHVGVAGHLTLGRGAIVGGGSSVIGNVPAGETWTGYPGRPHREWLRAQAALLKLGAAWKRIERILQRPPEQ